MRNLMITKRWVAVDGCNEEYDFPAIIEICEPCEGVGSWGGEDDEGNEITAPCDCCNGQGRIREVHLARFSEADHKCFAEYLASVKAKRDHDRACRGEMINGALGKDRAWRGAGLGSPES
jgi:hypothetical protein